MRTAKPDVHALNVECACVRACVRGCVCLHACACVHARPDYLMTSQRVIQSDYNCAWSDGPNWTLRFACS